MLFVGVGRFSGKRAVGSMDDVLKVARNVLNRDAFVVTDSAKDEAKRICGVHRAAA
jgi:hypothetical protein